MTPPRFLSLLLALSVLAPRTVTAQTEPAFTAGATLAYYQLGFGDVTFGTQRVWTAGVRLGFGLATGVHLAAVAERSVASNISDAPKITALRGELEYTVTSFARGYLSPIVTAGAGAMYFDTRHRNVPLFFVGTFARTGWRAVGVLGVGLTIQPLAQLSFVPRFDGVVPVGRSDVGIDARIYLRWSVAATWRSR